MENFIFCAVNVFINLEDCRDFAFKCLPEKTCIMVSSVCDGVWDCQSGYDELTSGGGCRKFIKFTINDTVTM